jgi:hypothetical protein
MPEASIKQRISAVLIEDKGPFADERGWGGLPPLFFVAPGGPANPGSFSSGVRKKMLHHLTFI